MCEMILLDIPFLIILFSVVELYYIYQYQYH